MIDILKFISVSLSIAILFIIPGLLLDVLLVKCVFIRGDKLAVIIGTVILVLVKQVWFSGDPWSLWTILMFLGLTLAVHRGDLSETLKRGKWWWKSQNKK